MQFLKDGVQTVMAEDFRKKEHELNYAVKQLRHGSTTPLLYKKVSF